jgi:hypothetical protein
VIFLYLDRLQNWLKGDRARGDDETGVRAVAAE